MSGNRHPKTHRPSDKDLKENPEIGQSPGLIQAHGTIEEEQGESTVEGDVLNDTTPAGGVNPNQRPRKNK